MTVPTHAKVTFPHTNGIPRDAVVHDMSFLPDDGDQADLDGIAESIIDFYSDSVAGSGTVLGTYFSGSMSRVANAARIDFYQPPPTSLDGTGPVGSPVHTRPFTLANLSGGYVNLPDEVALKVTFYASGWEVQPETAPHPTLPDKIIRPRARFRGGVFLGPFTSKILAGGETVSARPGGSWYTDIDRAAARFMDERPDFAVWSRVDGSFRLVQPDGHWKVDDAFDTIRKRGVAATTRVTVWP